jgi:hypothetical protein
MEKGSVESIVLALNQNRVQYLIAGGLAVVAHGYVRFTADVDLILAIDQPNLASAVVALQSLSYQPRAPVSFEDFINPDKRRQWAAEKNMTVFSLFSTRHSATEIDLFLEPPLDFLRAYDQAVRLEVAPGTTASFCSLDDLIQLKTKAARPRDLLAVKTVEPETSAMKDLPEKSDAAEWERGWEGHEHSQRERLAKLSFLEKLAWLEEAHRLVRQMASNSANSRTPK